MRFIPANCLSEGMILGRHLLGRNGELLLSAGSELKISYMDKIKELGYSGIYIEDEISRDIEIYEVISEKLRYKTVKTVKENFSNVERGKEISNQQFSNINTLANDIVDEILSNRDTMINMIDIKVFDDYTFYHSVNVAVLCIVVGVALNLNRNQLCKLGLAAILHDIGKVFIPREVLNKADSLSDDEFETIKSHSYKGYLYLKDKFDIPVAACVGILQHHEKYDGTGYPNGVAAEQISLFARIISVADVYDALTSNRPYRKAMIPSEAFEYIMGGGGTLFDPQVINCFTQRVAPYPIGSCIKLSSNKTGIVVENYSDCSLRPKIKVIMHGDTKVDPYIIDLRNDKKAIDVTITGVIDR